MDALVTSDGKRMASLVLLLTLLLPATPSASDRAEGGGYSHATIGCLQGGKGPGFRLVLAKDGRCGTLVTYPNIDVDVRELPTKGGKTWKVNIGLQTWAFRCRDSNEPCQQASSGTIVFDTLGGAQEGDHPRPTLHDAGHYELRFKSGSVEQGTFRVECSSVCG
jgi:hypothetical protein